MEKMILNNFTVTKIVQEAKSYTNTKSKVMYKDIGINFRDKN